MKLPLLGLMMLLPSVYLVQVFNFHLEAVNVSLSRALLDTVCPDKPLIVWHRSFHELFANSEALKQTEFEVY